MDQTTETSEVTEPKSGGNKKVLWIVGIVAVLIIAGAVASRGFLRGTALPDGVEADRNADGSVTYTNEEASVTINGGEMPSNWPSDAPEAYSGATLIYSGTNNPATGAEGSAVMYTTTASFESVLQYYNARLEAESWTIEATANISGMTVITAKKDKRTFVVYVSRTNDAVQVTSGIEFGE